MEKQIQELESILKQELDLHNSLLHVAKEFNGAIKENDIELIRRKTTEQDEHICSIERLEESRNICCKSFLSQFNIAINNIKLTQIIDKLPDSWKTRLSQLHSSLKAVILELSNINSSNRILLEEADRIIGKTLTYIIKPVKSHCSYSQQGKVPVKPSDFTFYNNII
jgi:flagellar biosynthesis/type III secretory pathway chaperone